MLEIPQRHSRHEETWGEPSRQAEDAASQPEADYHVDTRLSPPACRVSGPCVSDRTSRLADPCRSSAGLRFAAIAMLQRMLAPPLHARRADTPDCSHSKQAFRVCLA